MKHLILMIILIISSVKTFAQQIPDPDFNYEILNPEYRINSGPVILFDEAHNNFHTIDGRYSSVNKILTNDGYRIITGKEKFSTNLLSTASILIIANPVWDTLVGDRLPTRSAFTKDEIEAVESWVSNGGSLFLIADHMPFSGSMRKLAAVFGFNLINGYAYRIDGAEEIFSRTNDNLLSNEITNGRNDKERIDSIIIFTGHGFLPPPDAKIITTLNNDYEILTPLVAGEFNDSTPGFMGKYLVNGAYREYGKGRVVMFGEAALFSAQLVGENKQPMGMNYTKARQNPQFLLNIIHWLDRKF